MLDEYSLPKYFWVEKLNTTCYLMNREYLRPILKKTPYELFYCKKPKINYFHVFGCRCLSRIMERIILENVMLI